MKKQKNNQSETELNPLKTTLEPNLIKEIVEGTERFDLNTETEQTLIFLEIDGNTKLIIEKHISVKDLMKKLESYYRLVFESYGAHKAQARMRKAIGLVS